MRRKGGCVVLEGGRGMMRGMPLCRADTEVHPDEASLEAHSILISPTSCDTPLQHPAQNPPRPSTATLVSAPGE
jgi:hypothetical protein